MKLIVEVVEYKGKGGVLAYLRSDEDADMVYDPIRQAEEVARLAEVAKEIEKTVDAYYSKDSGLMPKVLKKSDKDPLTE